MGEYFDDLTKAVAKGVGRRGALYRLGLGLVGAVAASIGMTAPEAQAGRNTCSACCGKSAVQSRTFLACVRACRNCAGGCGKLCFDPVNKTYSCCSSEEECMPDGICYGA
jgi:hypothetical protein